MMGSNDRFRWDKTGVKGKVTYETFGCNVFQEDIPTPDRLNPDVVVVRKTEFGGRMNAPDGRRIKYWGFSDPTSSIAAERGAVYPSPVIRVREGQIVHTRIDVNKNAHTIHHHGIEPTTVNDGVGHVSFEVKGRYFYQWKPAHAGTFFYHCHRNTVFHFEMGMFGLLIVDPPEGRGTLYENGPTYDVEGIWVFDDMDPRWHEMGDHDVGMCGDDAGLNRFEPRYFFVSGVFAQRSMTDSRSVVSAWLGQKILIRILNASYSLLRITLGCDALWVGCDGHCLGREAWCDTKVIPANTPFELSSAQRYDLMLMPPAPGTYVARTEFLHWITGAVQDGGRGVVQTKVVVV